MPGRKIAVLYVDDDNNRLKAFEDTFNQYYEIFTTTSSSDAMNILEKKDVHVVIAGHYLPGRKGSKLMELITEKHPEPVRMVLAQYHNLEAVIEAVNKTRMYKYLTQPYMKEELKEAIEECFIVYRMHKEQSELISRLIKANRQMEFMLNEQLVS